jgi:acyl-CoA dehydrogenase
MIGFFAAAIAAFFVLAYFQVPILGWTFAGGLLLGYLSVVADFGQTTNIVLGAAFVIVAALCNIKPLRRLVFSDPILGIYRQILPDMSQTEKEAIDAGTVWWDADLFSGKPDWNKLLAIPAPRLTAEEQAFLDGPCEEVCAMTNDWEITHERYDLPPQVWQYIKDKGFLGMIIPKKYGGLGFSALAHSAVVMKLSTRSNALSVTVMVPNSLGPAELLLHYGSEEQKNHYLPRLAKGLEVPCFALTSPEAGSDAASIPDYGVVCKGQWQGKEVLGMRVTWDKRYITLGPVATLLGLAFRLYDPEHLLGDKEDLGITCALVPTNTAGVNIGPPPSAAERGVPERPELRQGRVHADRLDHRRQGLRRQRLDDADGLPCGRAFDLAADFVGWRRKSACSHHRRLLSRAQSVQDADRQAGRRRGSARPDRREHLHDGRNADHDRRRGRSRREAGGDLGDREVPHDRARAPDRRRFDGHPRRQRHLPRAEQLGRTRLPGDPGRHHGRGREHPDSYADHLRPGRDPLPSVRIARDARGEGSGRKRGLDRVRRRVHFAHRPHGLERRARVRARITSSRLGQVPRNGAPETRHYYRFSSRLAAAFAFLADVSMLAMGGALKRKEKISGRLGDVLSMLYLVSATLKHYEDQGRNREDIPLIRWAVRDALYSAQHAIDQILSNFPVKAVARLLRWTIFPLGMSFRPPLDSRNRECAQMLLAPGAPRDRLTAGMYIGKGEADPTGVLEAAFAATIACEPIDEKLRKAVKKGKMAPRYGVDLGTVAREKDMITQDEYNQWLRKEALRKQVIKVDDFPQDFGRAEILAKLAQEKAPTAKAA